MTFSFASMVRMTVMLAVGSTLLAIGVSRLDPPRPAHRSLAPVADFQINDFFLRLKNRRSRWIDSRTGQISTLPMPDDDVFEAASCSPWVDEAGHCQVVGRWSDRTLDGPDTISHAFGLARYSFPDGRLLDHIPCEVVPIAPPCWFPGTRAQVLFAAGDGQLYQIAFETNGAPTSTGEPPAVVNPSPLKLIWACPRPGIGEIFINQVAWPEDARLGGRLVVSMRVQELNADGRPQYSRTRLWWLKLNHSATRVIEVGPLLNYDVSGPLAATYDERSPSVVGLPDGSLGLAYTRQSGGRSGWSVCLGSLRIDSDHRLVPAAESTTRVLIPRSHPAPLAFSPDGRWLNVLADEPDHAEAVVRVSTLAPVDEAPRKPTPCPR